MAGPSHCGILIKRYNARSSASRERRSPERRSQARHCNGTSTHERIHTKSRTPIFDKQSATGLNDGPEPRKLSDAPREGLLQAFAQASALPSRKAFSILNNLSTRSKERRV